MARLPDDLRNQGLVKGEYDNEDVVIVQTTVADYRVPVFRAMASAFGGKFRVFAGRRYFSDTIRNAAIGEPWHVLVENVFLVGGRFCFQRGASTLLLNAGVVIAEGNPRVLSTWLLLLARRVVGRPSVIWSHAFSRKGAGSKGNWVRHAMFRLADVIVVYTASQAAELRQAMGPYWRDRITFAPNAVSRRDQCRPEVSPDPTDVIYVGRLVPQKKPLLLLRGFAQALQHLPPETTLQLVGDGPERDALESAVEELGLVGRVIIHGHIGDVDRLAELYRKALVAVSPGYVGLSAIQAMSFGVPILVARDEPHAPEVEACREGETAGFFDSNSPEDLAEALIRINRDRGDWIERRPRISGWIRDNYTVDAMVEAFREVVDSLVGRK